MYVTYFPQSAVVCWAARTSPKATVHSATIGQLASPFFSWATFLSISTFMLPTQSPHACVCPTGLPVLSGIHLQTGIWFPPAIIVSPGIGMWLQSPSLNWRKETIFPEFLSFLEAKGKFSLTCPWLPPRIVSKRRPSSLHSCISWAQRLKIPDGGGKGLVRSSQHWRADCNVPGTYSAFEFSVPWGKPVWIGIPLPAAKSILTNKNPKTFNSKLNTSLQVWFRPLAASALISEYFFCSWNFSREPLWI